MLEILVLVWKLTIVEFVLNILLPKDLTILHREYTKAKEVVIVIEDESVLVHADSDIVHHHHIIPDDIIVTDHHKQNYRFHQAKPISFKIIVFSMN